MGQDLVKEANENNGRIDFNNFVQWLYVEQNGMKIVNEIVA